jgi:tetratricopeptide (TPR) repeat protein
MAYYDKTLTSNPEMGWAYRDRSYLHRADGHYDQAIQDYEKCIDMKPEMMTELAQFYAYRGILHAYSDRKMDMENDLNKSIELDPTSSFSLIALSSHYADTNRPQEVMQVLENAISQSANAFAPGDMHRLLSARHDYLAYYTAGNFPGFGGQTEKVKQYKQEMLMSSANERIA